MPATPRFALVRGADQWQRAAFIDTALVDGDAQLAWETPPADATPAEPQSGAGLAFDASCRLYRSLPEQGDVERILWSAEDPLRPQGSPEPLRLFGGARTPLAGDFAFSDASAAYLLRTPRALAVDAEERLFIAASGGREVVVFDLWSRRLLRRVPLPGEPVDLACDGEHAYVLLANPTALYKLGARASPRRQPLAAAVTEPSRLSIWEGSRVLVLNAAGTATSQVLDARTGAVVVDRDVCAHASDIENYRPRDAAQSALVISRRGGEDFARVELPSGAAVSILPLTARSYDGRGIVRTPDQRIAYWTAHGLRYAVAAKPRYARRGEVIGFRLDSGEFQTSWGRLFVDGCIPRDSTVSVRCIATDEPPDSGLVPRTPPVNAQSLVIGHPELSPPLPAKWMVDAAGPARPLHRRPGSELAWLRRRADDEFVTYEAPIMANPGRYLWVLLELAGNSVATPRIRALRAEHPGHDYLQRLPRTLSTDTAAASFLRRYLAMFAGQLGEMDERARRRHVLLDPFAVQTDALPWLASCLGMPLDERWSEMAKRTAIAEAIGLFKTRGTIAGLSRFIEIAAGVRPIIIEKYRLRGGGSVGGEAPQSSNAILGAGFRVGGAVGTVGTTPLETTAADAFATHAHRFTVLVPSALREEDVAMLGDLLDKHRPAHTLYDLCTIGSGMRVGRGLHVGLSSAIGRGGGFSQLQVGGSALGRGAVVGRAQPGIRPGATRLPGALGSGSDSRVG